jgi:hypothetical protein
MQWFAGQVTDASPTMYSRAGVDHNLWDSRLMHQVIVCGNARRSGTSMLIHHLQCTAVRMRGPSSVCGTGI